MVGQRARRTVLPRNTIGWTKRAQGAAIAIFFGLATICASPVAASATPGAQPQEDDKRPLPKKKLNPGRRVIAPPTGLLRADQIKAIQAAGKNAKGSEPEELADDEKPPRKRAVRNRPNPKARSAKVSNPREQAEEEELSPWDKVEIPDEMETGIEFRRPRRGARFAFNLVDADLIELIKIIGNITGKAFILGGKTPHLKATIYAPTKITAAEAYEAFLSVLQVNGLTVVPAGRYLKVMPTGDSTGRNTPITRGRAPRGDEIVTRLHRLEHVSADDLTDLLTKFKSPEGDITVYAPTNMLIITDYGSSIRRLIRLIEVIDQPGTGEQIWIEPVNYADATELADRVMEIFETSEEKSSSKRPTRRRRPRKGAQDASVVGDEQSDAKISKILADERTNSLIIVASENAYLRILELVKRLDVPMAGEGSLHVHKLQHADAEELAKTLNNLSKGSRRRTSSKKGGGDSQSLFEGEMEISPDKATNSLVIVSSMRDYLSLKGVIDTLDVMQRQVFVEAVIMEVSLDKNREMGIGFHLGNTIDTGDGKSFVYGSSQPSSKVNSMFLSPDMLSGLAAGIQGPAIEDLAGTGFSIPSFGVALQAMQTNSDVNVLSTPHILATDNVEAMITVGENVPLQSGYNPAGAFLSQAASQAGGASGAGAALGMLGGGMGGGFGGFSIQRQNVGLSLKVTPYINDDDQVKLEIELEISEVKSADSELGPNISKQNAKTTSVVADQQTIVIGGLITDNQVISTRKVPVLGDIPILGALFRSKSSLTRKRNLLIFLTPYIIRSSEDFRNIFKHKMAQRREFIERYTAFEYHRVDPHLDWSRTNGAIAEINAQLKAAVHEQELREASQGPEVVVHGAKEPIRFFSPSSEQGGEKPSTAEAEAGADEE